MIRRIGLVIGVIAAALVLGAAIHVVEPGYLLALVLAVLLLILAVRNLRAFLWFSLAFKPIIDIFYNRAIGPTTVQRGVGVIAPLLGAMLVVGSEVNVVAFPLATPLFAFALINIAGVVLSIDTNEGIQMLFRVIGPIVFYFAAAQILPDDAAVRRFTKVLLVVLIVPYAYALLQLSGVVATPTVAITGGLEGVRLFGPYTGPWDLARFLVVSVPLCLLVISDTTDKTETALWWLYLGANVLIAVFTNLKYAQVAVFLELLLWFALTGQRAKLAAVVATATALVVANLRFLSEMYADVTVLFVTKNVSSATDALSGRIGVWELYLSQYRDMPLVYRFFGTGFDYARIIGSQGGIRSDPHNDILRVLVSNGWVGLAVYVWLLVAMAVFLARSIGRLGKAGEEYRLKICYVGVCVFVSYVAGSLTARPSQYPSLAWFLWTLFGLVAVTFMAVPKEVDHA